MITQAMQQQIVARIVQDIAKIKAKYGVDLKMPTVSYDLRGTTAGTANYRKWHIQINPVLLVENFDDMLNDTVPHELCHLACDTIYPEATRFQYGRKRQPHGARWKEIMLAIGVNPTRTHNYNTDNARVKAKSRYNYFCSGCKQTLTLGPKHHASLQRGDQRFHCRGHKLQLVDAQITPAPMRIAAQAPAPVAAPTTTTNKREACIAWFKANRSATRVEMIAAFVALGCTPAGASTYYYTIKNMPM